MLTLEEEMSALTPVAQDPVKNDTEDVHCEAVKLC